MLTVSELWNSKDEPDWKQALDRYGLYVKPGNLELERELDQVSLDQIRDLDAQGWFEFLREKYFKWKYTSPNRYRTTTNSLGRYLTEVDGFDQLLSIKQRLLTLDSKDIRSGLKIGSEIKGWVSLVRQDFFRSSIPSISPPSINSW